MDKLPLRECPTCILRDSCEHIESLNTIIEEKLLPIDFELAFCTSYAPDELEVDMDDGDYFIACVNEIMSTIIEEGSTPLVLVMSKETRDAVGTYLNMTKDSITLRDMSLKLIIDNQLPYGEFDFITEDKEG